MYEDKNELVKKLNQDIMKLINDIQRDNTLVITFDTATKNKGYFFNFPSYPDLVIAASSHKTNFLTIKDLRACVLDTNTWKKSFYASSASYSKSQSKDVYFSDSDGLSESNLFHLVKFCANKLQLSLNYELDKEKIDLHYKTLDDLYLKKKQERRIQRQNNAMTSDLTLIKLFDSEFSIPDYVVLEHFLWAMGRDNFKAENVIKTVKEVWSEMENKNKSMTIYMPLISLHVKERMQ